MVRKKALLNFVATFISCVNLGAWGSSFENEFQENKSGVPNAPVIAVDANQLIQEFIPPSQDFIASHTCCGKFNQFLFQCCIESCYPWARVSSWVVGFVGVASSFVGVSLMGGIASGAITNSDPTVLWIAFASSVVAAGAKIWLMFNSELLRTMKDDAEKNFQALSQNNLYLLHYYSSLYDKFVNERHKRMQLKEKNEDEIELKIHELKAQKNVAIQEVLKGMPGGKRFLKQQKQQRKTVEEMV